LSALPRASPARVQVKARARFANNTGAPVFIAYVLQGHVLRATLYGRKAAGRKVSLAARTQRLGPGHLQAQLYRTIRHRGKAQSKERLFSHTYRWNWKATVQAP
jgi:hypothetical protein